MSGILFDVRKAERRLKAAGASDELAEAAADLMSQAVVLNLDSLVTKDYLDARIAEVDSRIADVDARIGEVDARLDLLRTELAGRFRLLHALFALLFAGVFIPQLQAWFGA